MSHTPPPEGGSPNHLAGQTSPYLLQHLYNPVDWRPWGDEALELARREQRPIFLSIGYAACHWCHVMERESFENPAVAELLNRNFVPIKVDREERPDIDEIYMNAVQLLTGQGGWPLSVFLLPDLRPFVGGTYFPPEDRHGRPGFVSLLQRIHEAWSGERDELERSASRLTEELQRIAAGPALASGTATVSRLEWSRAVEELTRRFEPRWGGFGGAPKFPPDGALALLLREHSRSGKAAPWSMAEKTLDGMALGGIYDHVGGGFARYSVDEKWLVPHFEKMLYNQALLVPLYIEAWKRSGKPLYRRVVGETLAFVRRELTAPDGGFFSSLDADSEGEEGKFYVWKPDEVAAALGPDDGTLFRKLYDVTAEGSFEGSNIPNLLGGSLAVRAAERGESEESLAAGVARMRERLLEARERRVRPGTDDKVLTAWNGLMIGALARAHQAFGDDADLAAARAAADFVLSRLVRDGRLLVSFRAGQARLNAYLDDHAFLARGLLELYEAGFETHHLAEAERLAETIVERFEDREHGGFFFTSDDHESLLTRNHSLHDGALPAGAGVAAETLLRLAVHRDRADFRRTAERALAALQPFVERMPSAYASLLIAADLAAGSPREVAILGDPHDPETGRMLAVVRRHTKHPLAVQHAAEPPDDARLALLRDRTLVGGRPTAYVCRNYACLAPVHDADALRERLEAD